MKQSGQGPYFGQKVWFSVYHQEKNLTSAIERYANEVKRVVGVLDAHLKKSGDWLVGDKCTYADLAFVPWDAMIPFVLGPDSESLFESAPNFKKWHDALMARPAVKKTMDYRTSLQKH